MFNEHNQVDYRHMYGLVYFSMETQPFIAVQIIKYLDTQKFRWI